MKPRVTFITLGVDDLPRAVAFFDMQPGLKLALFPRQNLAHDAGVPPEPRSRPEFALAHNVAAREEVDAVIQQAVDAGATIIKPPQETFWGGYAGYFADPGGHLWEVVWNPNLLPED